VSILRRLRTRAAMVVLVVLWVALLLVARVGAWERAQAAVTVGILLLGVISAIAFLQRWGDTQDAVVTRDAEEVDRILVDEEKAAATDEPPSPSEGPSRQ
jgi:hypothetical protein